MFLENFQVQLPFWSTFLKKRKQTAKSEDVDIFIF